MSATQAPSTATGRLRELLDLLDEVGPRETARRIASAPVHEGLEVAYLLGRLRQAARYALDEWEGRA